MGRTRGKIHGQQVDNQGHRVESDTLETNQEEDQNLDGATTSPTTWD